MSDNTPFIYEANGRTICLMPMELKILAARLLRNDDKDWIASQLKLYYTTVYFFMNVTQAKVGVNTELALLKHCHQQSALMEELKRVVGLLP